MVQKIKNKEIKITAIILATVFLLFTLSGCTPLYITLSHATMIDSVIFDANIHGTGKYDDYGRALCSAENLDAEGQLVYTIMQSYFTDNEMEMSYITDKYYFYDFEGKGEESEGFQQFLIDNYWGSPDRVPEEKLSYGFQEPDKAMNEFKCKSNWEEDVIRLYLNATVKRQEGVELIWNTRKVDHYMRDLCGIKIPSSNENEMPKLYAVIFQATTSTECYYLNDIYFSEIRLDHYVEDLEALKRANNWGEKLTVADLENMDKFVIESENVQEQTIGRRKLR